MSTFEREWQRIAPYRWQGQKRTRLEADCRESPPLWVASSKERTASAVLLASVYELDACCSSLSSAAGLCFLLGAASATILRLETGARTCTEGCLVLNLSCASCSEPGLMTAIAPRYSSKGVAIPYSTQGGSALVSLASQKARASLRAGWTRGVYWAESGHRAQGPDLALQKLLITTSLLLQHFVRQKLLPVLPALKLPLPRGKASSVG